MTGFRSIFAFRFSFSVFSKRASFSDFCYCFNLKNKLPGVVLADAATDGVWAVAARAAPSGNLEPVNRITLGANGDGDGEQCQQHDEQKTDDGRRMTEV